MVIVMMIKRFKRNEAIAFKSWRSCANRLTCPNKYCHDDNNAFFGLKIHSRLGTRLNYTNTAALLNKEKAGKKIIKPVRADACRLLLLKMSRQLPRAQPGVVLVSILLVIKCVRCASFFLMMMIMDPPVCLSKNARKKGVK